jgi:REP element-mobilizing transposase RayT
MPIPEKFLVDFEEHKIYHVYNRTNNKEALFLSDENRRFFLKKFKLYLSDYVNTYSWCLLPNHFHFLITIKSCQSIIETILNKDLAYRSLTEKKFLENEIDLSQLVEQTFKRFFQSYSLAFNKANHRNGNLFYKPFKRVLVKKDSQLTNTIIYIHANPLKHKIVEDFMNYKWSSWHSLISDKKTSLLRSDVIDWFGSKEMLINTHLEMTEYYSNCNTAIED